MEYDKLDPIQKLEREKEAEDLITFLRSRFLNFEEAYYLHFGVLFDKRDLLPKKNQICPLCEKKVTLYIETTDGIICWSDLVGIFCAESVAARSLMYKDLSPETVVMVEIEKVEKNKGKNKKKNKKKKEMKKRKEECQICFSKKSDVFLPCKHVGCIACITTSFEKREVCPFCNSSFKKEEISNISQLTKEMKKKLFWI
jgi:hypothetical protein